MKSMLRQILADTRVRVEKAKSEVPVAELIRQSERMLRPRRRFRRALAWKAQSGVTVIAELKKTSLARGAIRGSFPVGRLAVQLAQGGAAALSVVTEESHYGGSLQHLREAAAATGLPCLRRDLVIDEYQVLESATYAADALLLVVGAVPDPELGMLYRRARELALDVLCEVHNEGELARAIAIGADMIGVNNRDLNTLAVDEEAHERLASQIPDSVLRVADSGIRSAADIRRLRAAGYSAFLVGEMLMESEDPGVALAQLIAATKSPPLGTVGVAGWSAGTKD